MNTDDLLNRLNIDGIDNLSVVYHDYSGRACAKTIPKERFAATLAKGVVFARANLSFSVDDHQSADASFLADTGDFLAVPDPNSYTRIPYLPATARVHAYMCTEDGARWEGCPRARLQNMVDAYAEQGLSVRVGLEPEFYLLEQVGEHEYRPVDHDGMFTLAGLERHYPLWKRISDDLRDMDIVLEQFGKEYGPAQYEGTPRYDEPVPAIDKFLLFKDVVRARARDVGQVVSFMPKPYAHLPGCGLHIHLSLWNVDGSMEVTPGASDEQPLSETGGHFAAGLLAHARGLTGVGSPIVNSYKRLLPGSWAPAHVCWAVGNRAALVRIPGLGRRRHIEYRSGDNATNAFLYVTALLAAGLDGIDRKSPLPDPVDTDVGHLSAEEADARGLGLLPTSLPEALDALETDDVLREALGEVAATEFLKVKRNELAAYALMVHPWERQMYLKTV